MLPHVPNEVLQLIFEDLVGDSASLANVGLVSRQWRTLSLPVLLREVDVSCHNRGRLHLFENSTDPPSPSAIRPIVMADELIDVDFFPDFLVPRQRAFLHLMVESPDLARHVRAFTWTFVWVKNEGGHDLTDIDYHTWEVLARLENVTRLDLASLHELVDPQYIRQSPARLFPAVTDLRLVGWMSRGLVRAILTSIDATKLYRLNLDHLQDEGELPGGAPMPHELATSRRRPYSGLDPEGDEGVISDELWARQERGDAAIFTGPMWHPLRFLRQSCLESMAHIEIRVGSLASSLDERNYITMCREIVEFIQSARGTLKTIHIGVGESPHLYKKYKSTCGTGRYSWARYVSSCRRHTSAFLRRLLPTLSKAQFTALTRVDLEGFRLMRGKDGQPKDPDSLIWQYIRDCPFVTENFTKRPNPDPRDPFTGFWYGCLSSMDQEQVERWRDICRRS